MSAIRSASRSSRRRRSRRTNGPESSTSARERFPSVWTATRNDLCFATTNRQRRAHRDRAPSRCGRRHRERELVEHDRAREGGARGRLRDRAAYRRARRARPRRHRRRARRGRHGRCERARGTGRRGDRKARTDRRRRAGARHRGGRILPTAARTARAAPRARRRGRARAGRRSCARTVTRRAVLRRSRRSTRRACWRRSATDRANADGQCRDDSDLPARARCDGVDRRTDRAGRCRFPSFARTPAPTRCAPSPGAFNGWPGPRTCCWSSPESGISPRCTPPTRAACTSRHCS